MIVRRSMGASALSGPQFLLGDYQDGVADGQAPVIIPENYVPYRVDGQPRAPEKLTSGNAPLGPALVAETYRVDNRPLFIPDDRTGATNEGHVARPGEESVGAPGGGPPIPTLSQVRVVAESRTNETVLFILAGIAVVTAGVLYMVK